MQFKVGAATDVGRVRAINEDAFIVRPELGLFVVCDGMGGAASGEVASQIAVKVIGDLYDATLGAEVVAGGYLPRTVRLGEAVRAANDAIYDHAEAVTIHAGMGTTVVSAWIEDHIVSLAHVGDSRAYLWHDGQIEPVTSDHSLVEAQVRAGLINREQSLTSAHQNVLLRALGSDLEVEVELDEVRVSAGDCLLLCSDGLTRMVPDAELADTLERFRGDPQGACAHLIAAANAKGGPDNITVVIVEVFD